MAGFKCPFCGQVMSVNNDTQIIHRVDSATYIQGVYGHYVTALEFHEFRCPHDDCRKRTIVAVGVPELEYDGWNEMIWPKFKGNFLPDFVPDSIRQDYEEACSIQNLSPKASAALSRRCLQGMIRDFWSIKDKKTLHQEIIALSGKVDQALIDALLSMKSIGNIGAHPETDVNLIVDIDTGEAKSLIQFLEVLVEDWYVARDRRTKVIQKVTETADQKKSAREGLD